MFQLRKPDLVDDEPIDIGSAGKYIQAEKTVGQTSSGKFVVGVVGSTAGYTQVENSARKSSVEKTLMKDL